MSADRSLLDDLRDLFKLGPQTTDFGAPSAFSGAPHPGVDIGVPDGTEIPTPVAGTVTKVYRDNVGGLQAEVTTPQGFRQIFAHLERVTAKVGDTLAVGQTVALSGHSGTVTGSHVHYEVRNAAGAAIDPRRFVEEFRSLGLDRPAPSSPAAPGPVTMTPVSAPAAGGYQPSGWQCALLLAGSTKLGPRDDAWLSSVTGIPRDKLQEAAYACAQGVKDTQIPGEEAAKSATALVSVVLGFIGNPANWTRLAFTAAGVLLIGVGTIAYMSSLKVEGPQISAGLGGVKVRP